MGEEHMTPIVHVAIKDAKAVRKSEHVGYAYIKREIVPVREKKGLSVCVYEIAPQKAAYPYHYHLQNEEVFYILSGSGLLKSPEDERMVFAGDFLYFQANENGAHKLTNVSETEPLIYIDFDTNCPLDVAFYPDSGKVGIFGKDIKQLYRVKDQAGYYDGE